MHRSTHLYNDPNRVGDLLRILVVLQRLFHCIFRPAHLFVSDTTSLLFFVGNYTRNVLVELWREASAVFRYEIVGRTIFEHPRAYKVLLDFGGGSTLHRYRLGNLWKHVCDHKNMFVPFHDFELMRWAYWCKLKSVAPWLGIVKLSWHYSLLLTGFVRIVGTLVRLGSSGLLIMPKYKSFLILWYEFLPPGWLAK